MTSAREQILTRIRSAIPTGERPAARDVHNAVARQYSRVGQLQREPLLELFEERLRDYEAGVYRCSEGEIARTIATVLAARAKNGLVIPSSVPRSWLSPNLSFLADDGLCYSALDKVPGVLTGCSAAVALSGTVILVHTPEDGRRALTLIPDYHLCVVFADQVSETLPEALGKLQDQAAMPITTISGPSATSDIEMTRVKGVHGPRVLDVILVI